MYAGSLYFKEATGLSIYVSSVCVLIITAVYVILGKQIGTLSKQDGDDDGYSHTMIFLISYERNE
jgi:hypothetical protein